MQLKRCCKCRVEKSITEFYRNKSKKDGLQTVCKVCSNENVKLWFKTPKGREAISRANRSKSGKAGRRKHDKTERRKEAKRRLRLTDKYKATHRKQSYAYRKRNPDKANAHSAVYYAIKKGKIPSVRSLICSFCTSPATHYHHHRGYSWEYRLDVIPVCEICHRKSHQGVL